MRRAALLALALISGSAYADEYAVVDSGRQIVLPGTLDLAVIDGSMIPQNCQLETIFGTQSVPADCVAFPRQASENYQALYVQALSNLGWNFAGGAANVFYFERPQPNTTCSDRLNFAGGLLGDPNEVAKYGRQHEGSIDWARITHLSFIFAIEPAPVCDEERYLQ